MLKEGVSKKLYGLIKKIMISPAFNDFNIGGGTNLAIKYNHRLSIDIDLFSTDIVGTEKLHKIINFFQKEFKEENIQILPMNFDSEQFAWLQIFINDPEIKTKVDIIQNLKLIKDITIIDHIRLINDIDIGALKLLSAADRGVQKDFYDLYLLTEKYSLAEFYDTLQYRNKIFSSNKDKCIFDISTGKPIARLEKDLTPLGNFTKASNKKQESNRIIFTEDSPINIAWPVLRDKWKYKVQELAKERGLVFKETPTAKSSNSKGRN